MSSLLNLTYSHNDFVSVINQLETTCLYSLKKDIDSIVNVLIATIS